jgi:hypothetical protein
VTYSTPTVLPRWKIVKRCFFLLPFVLLLTGCDPKFWKMQMWMWSENHKSLDFYGKIVDQDGRPVEGVKVIAAVGTIVSFTKSGETKYVTASDAEGRFSFIGIRGSGCGYLLEKSGYEFSQRQTFASRPKDYIPDPNKPALFSIWKLHGANPMVHTAFDSRVPYDGQATTFDIFTGRKSESGDLRITLMRNPLKIQRGRESFDWSVKIQVAGGSLVETSNLYPYEAPESGYVPSFDFGVAKDTPKWTQRLTKDFYIHTAKGNYGRITVDLTTDSERPQGTGVTITTWVNPSGSRNLEWEPTMQVNR